MTTTRTRRRGGWTCDRAQRRSRDRRRSHRTGLQCIQDIVSRSLIPLFEKTTEHRLKVAFGSTDPLKVRIEKGEAVDLALIGEGAIDDLIKQGKLVAASRVVVARSGLGVAVRKGAPKPDLSTIDAFKRTIVEREIDRLQRARPDRHLSLEPVRQARRHRRGESEIQGRLRRHDGRHRRDRDSG